jgi:hypothetical protein
MRHRSQHEPSGDDGPPDQRDCLTWGDARPPDNDQHHGQRSRSVTGEVERTDRPIIPVSGGDHPATYVPVGGGQLQQAQRPARQLSRAPESAICSREDPSPLSRSVARWGPLRSSLGAKVRRDGVMTEVPDQTIIPKRRTFRSKRPF